MIETERLILRNYTTEDFDALYEIVSDKETMQHYPSPFDEEKTRDWIKWNLENYEKYGFGLWAVVLKETGEFIGDCGITIQNIDGELLPEIGYHIHKKYWRRGFAKEASRAVRDWVFKNTKYNEIYSYMKYTNVPSYSTAIANGMKKVKEYIDPKNEISYAFSISRLEWENLIGGKKTVTKQELKDALSKLGVEKGMTLEVHSSLKSFGTLEGGAETLINSLKEIVTEDGSIFMPALRLSREMEPTEEDKKLGITVKIKVLESDAPKTAMGIVADTFRSLPDTYSGKDVISTSGWGKHGKEALTGGLDYPIHNGGKALLFGVDIYKLTAMHYVEGITPKEINEKFAPSDEVNKIYPPEEWFIETGHPPLKAWYTIQSMAYKKGLIKETFIGNCKVMFFDIWEVVSLYENELKNRPFELWGMKKIIFRKNEMEKIISACGNDCSICPRYNATLFEKTADELHATAILWEKIGYRDHIVTNEEISCSGCKESNWCRYKIVKCTTDKGIATCGQCEQYPCNTIKECFEVTKSFEPACLKACTLEEYEIIKKAFFEKKGNLDFIKEH